MDFKQHVNEPSHNLSRTLDLVISYRLNINVSSAVDLALSDHHCVFFIVFYCTLPTSMVVKKCCLTPEATSNFLVHIARNQVTSTPSSVDSLLNAFNNELVTALDAVPPLKN